MLLETGVHYDMNACLVLRKFNGKNTKNNMKFLYFICQWKSQGKEN